MGEVVQFIPRPNPERLQKAFDAVCKELNRLEYDKAFGQPDSPFCWSVRVRNKPITDHKEYPQEPA